MAKTKISEYDSTAANNTDIDSINIAEGMSPSNVNNALRQMMAHLKTEFFKTGTGNTSLGDAALDSLDGSSPGGSNVAIGKDAGTALTTGSDNVAVGHSALKTEDANGRNTAVGFESLLTLNAGADGENVAVGYRAGKALTLGVQNTLIGVQAGDALTHADFNTAVGRNALSGDTQGHKSTAVGVGALNVQNFTSSTDTHNTAVGHGAGGAVTTATRNTAVGSSAGASNQTSLFNTYVGHGAGENTTGQGNTFIGDVSGNSVVAGEFNTLLGQQAGNAITSGNKNTVIGRYNGNSGGLDIRTSSNNIVLSDGDGNPRGYYHGGLTSPKWVFDNPTSGQVATQIVNSGSPSPFGLAILFQNAAPDNNTQYFIDCSDNSGTRARIESDGDFQSADNSFGSLSDEKLKENIADASSQWDDIKAVRVRKFSMKSHNSDTANRIGVIAQELEASGMNGLVKDCPDLTQEGDNITEADTSTKAVKYSILYMKAVKALQEAMARIETLETKVAALEG